MTHFLSSDSNPNGYRLEDILGAVRRDLILRSVKIADDQRVEARSVLDNNIRILQLLSEAMHLAERSTHVLDKAYGPSQSAHGGPPRIGVA
ncbi:MAG TPA: histidine kinase [Alphaproteobacteria bacterium]|nr:histidine kinase [Alphaproteobacteria bacterium]